MYHYDPRERIKRTISGILDYYGISYDTDYEPVFGIDSLDVVAYVESEETPDMAILVEMDPKVQKDFKKLIRTPNLKWIFIVAPKEYLAIIQGELKLKKIPQNKRFAILPVPSPDSLELEDRIRDITSRKDAQRYFVAIKEKAIPDSVESEILTDFEKLIGNERLDIEKAKDVIYKAAVGRMSILSGRSVFRSPDEEIREREKDLSKEAIFLTAVGLLKEEEKKEGNLNTEAESTFYLSLSDSERALKVAAEIVDERIGGRKREMKKIMNQYPHSFNFIVLTGSLGIFTPKPLINIERQRLFSTGVIRTSYQYEKTDLVELIRATVNALNIEVNEWNRINCLASFVEIRGLVSEYFEKFERIGVAVRGYRGYRKLYLPLRTMARFLSFSDWRDSYDKEKLKEFSLYDTLLRTIRTDRDIYERIKDLDISEEDIRNVLSETMKMGLTSHLLPKGSAMPFAIYKQQKFSNFCLERMRSVAEDLLEITW